MLSERIKVQKLYYTQSNSLYIKIKKKREKLKNNM